MCGKMRQLIIFVYKIVGLSSSPLKPVPYTPPHGMRISTWVFSHMAHTLPNYICSNGMLLAHARGTSHGMIIYHANSPYC